MMRAPPVAPPLPRPPPPPPMGLPPPSQGPAPPLSSQPIQHMSAAPQVGGAERLCVCDLTRWASGGPAAPFYLPTCPPPGLRNGLHGVRSIHHPGAAPPHQTDAVDHPGGAHGVLRPPRPRRTQKNRR